MMLGKPPSQILLSDWSIWYQMNVNEIVITDVITFCFLILKCLHQFSCDSCQKQGSPSTIVVSIGKNSNYISSFAKQNHWKINEQISKKTRMHSSRICTACSSTIPGGSPWQSRDPPGQRPPPYWAESQTGVKTLPSRNFVCGGN